MLCVRATVSESTDELLWVAGTLHRLYAAGLVWLERRVELDYPELIHALRATSDALRDVATGIPSLLENAAFSLEEYSIVCDKLRVTVKLDDHVEVEVEAETGTDYSISFEDCPVDTIAFSPCEDFELDEPVPVESIVDTTCAVDTEKRGRVIITKYINNMLYHALTRCKGKLVLFNGPGFALRYAENIGRLCRVAYTVGISPDEDYDEPLLEMVFNVEIDFEKMTATARVTTRAWMGGALIPIAPVWSVLPV